MRILHVSNSYLPQLGGIELHVDDLARRQRTRGHQVSVATLTPGPPDADDAVIRLPGVSGIPGRGVRAELDRVIHSGAFDVVHVHSSLVSPLAWTAVGAGVRSRLPTVLTMHSMLPGGAAARVLRALVPTAGADVVWTAVSAAAAASLGGVLPDLDVTVLPNGIDPDDWAPSGGRQPGGPLTVVSVLRTARRKRPLPLLDILETIRREVPSSTDLRAVVVGAGPLDEAITRRIAGSELSSWVVQTGQLPRAEIRTLLHHSDLYLAPATLESFGIAALEARSAGLPVIGMAGGGIGDFIEDGREGFLVGSDDEMAACAARLLREPAELSRMQQHNRTYHPSITWPRVLDLHDGVYAAAGASSAASTQHGRPSPARR